ncbi:hypothetical protein BH09BAC2_BH09BAC2_04990 [soil metagenome]
MKYNDKKFWNNFCCIITLFLFCSLPSFSQRLSTTTLPVYNKLQSDLKKGVVPTDFYARNVGFFCKKEIIVEKFIKFPFLFRLGTVGYCNYLEGKRY